jgi:RNA polymerase sigma factor (sigma-70 family)
MTNASGGSVTRWLTGLKTGDEEAARELWNRYFTQLVDVAARRLKSCERESDGEDVALSALKSLCMGVRDGRFPQLASRDGLWPLLVTMTARKASDEIRRQRAKKRDVAAQEPLDQLDVLIGREPSPEFTAMLVDEANGLLQRLNDDALRTIARRKLEGCSNHEIARQLSVTSRTVERKLALIRQEWEDARRDEV